MPHRFLCSLLSPRVSMQLLCVYAARRAQQHCPIRETVGVAAKFRGSCRSICRRNSINSICIDFKPPADSLLLIPIVAGILAAVIVGHILLSCTRHSNIARLKSSAPVTTTTYLDVRIFQICLHKHYSLYSFHWIAYM
jgi:hypothetical protein